MPLHLLGKKSWNVYNADNIARVRRDEADAQAREEAEEQRIQAVDGERRLAILRGDTAVDIDVSVRDDQEDSQRARDHGRTGRDEAAGRRKRKRAGEDDTDFELRCARENTDSAASIGRELATMDGRKGSRRIASNVSIIDSAGHISLFDEAEQADGRGSHVSNKEEKVDREASRKRRELEDLYRVRFANAAGKDGAGLVHGGPWYAKEAGERDPTGIEAPTVNVWGNADPRRPDRARARIEANDPLALMKKGASQVRDIQQQRKRLEEEREQELRELRREERRVKKRRILHGREPSELDDPEDFSLDETSRRRRSMSNKGENPEPSRVEGKAQHRGSSSRDDRHRKRRQHDRRQKEEG